MESEMSPSGALGELVTVLSIDGGGVKGLISGVVLAFLEAELQKLDGKEVRLADYFDVIAGTSTGGLITAMITAPDNNNRPLYAAKDIVPFYLKLSPKIFPHKNSGGLLGSVVNLFGTVAGPKYNGKYLHSLLKQFLGDTRMQQTLSSIVIPAFDIKLLQPVIFSTGEAKRDVTKDALLADVCIGTSAAPTYFPAHYFETQDSRGNIRSFNLVDGGVAANNPTLLAMNTVTNDLLMKREDLALVKAADYKKYLILSLGTGNAKIEQKYSASVVSKWGVLGWLYDGGSVPLIDVFTQASEDMVDIHVSTLFKAFQSQKNYLRIETDDLEGNTSSVDISTEENMQNLIKIGEAQLEKGLSRVNLDTGMSEVVEGAGTNRSALIRFAEVLSNERRARLAKSASQSGS
ncbi:patatin-like protein 2 isoform X1 [Papaver somniferum]|uniref:patatin-like protein 2 isoform X1 n=1 Tax=Papaver somniferum TaxID=3469 RepID=UPI000E704A07|nr:patatin-like protein 2 isoform X1 [Papaver somniferum]